MSVSYDLFKDAFLGKVNSYDMIKVENADILDETMDDYVTFACSQFNKICKYDLSPSAGGDPSIAADIPDQDLTEIVDIVSDGMVMLWMKQFVNRQEILENLLNTRDFTTYSPGELLYRIGNTYKDAESRFIRRMREYSYDHGDLTVLHL